MALQPYFTSHLVTSVRSSSNICLLIYGLGAIIQPPIMRALTTKKERQVTMEQLRRYLKPKKSYSHNSNNPSKLLKVLMQLHL